jgi:hypothetical protein
VDQILIGRDPSSVDVSPDGLRRLLAEQALPEPVRLLLAGLDGLAALPPAELTAEVAVQVAGVLLAARDRVQALALRAVADVDARDLYVLDASPSTGTWVVDQHTSMPRSHVDLARRLDRVPQVTARVAAGGITVDAAVQIARALDRLRRHMDRPDGLIDGQPTEQVLPGVLTDGICQLVGEALGGLAIDDPRLIGLHLDLIEIVSAPLPELCRLESGFLLLAAHVPQRLLAPALGVLVDALLPNQLAERSDDAHARRGLELRRDPSGSGWLLRGSLDEECGERLHTALSADMVTDPENATDTAAAAAERAAPGAGADPAPIAASPRARTQRRHDALNVLLGRLLGSGVLGTRSKVPVQIAVTVSLDALHDQPGALPARTGSGAVVPIGVVQKWLCDSAITRFVLGLGNKVVEISHTERTCKPQERRIKLLETGGICQGAGCWRS